MSLSVSVWCSTELAVDCNAASPCLLLVWLGWADLRSRWVTVFQRRFSSSGFYAFHVGFFLQSPLTTVADLATSPLCSYFPLSCVAVDHLQSHSSTSVCFFIIFFFCCKAEPRTQLCWTLVTAAGFAEKTWVVRSSSSPAGSRCSARDGTTALRSIATLQF